LVVGGIYYKLQVSHMKLCASRAFWLVAYPGQGHEMLFDAHTRLRISAIVDACFRLIVDGVSVPSWTLWGSAQVLGQMYLNRPRSA